MAGAVSDYVNNVLDVVTVPEKRMGGRGYDQSLNHGKFDIYKSVLECAHKKFIRPSYL